jgi:hypothetical protein
MRTDADNPFPRKVKGKIVREAHTVPTKIGMGSYYGRAVKAPLGRMRGEYVGIRPVSKKGLKRPPRSVV